eukprot:TRINITY_DN16272_c0_g1_i1.p1 TRINITY_DN16272_c0_g1~~TRINITY_DN16272_c0_g1_i1.p1  ORF type:complete len:267 (+),score=85.58 TRINITY_DN16272_c0_g1_i1:94-894(+)
MAGVGAPLPNGAADDASSSNDEAEYDFDQAKGLHRRGKEATPAEAAKMAKAFKYTAPDPHFGPELDDEDEQWVRDEVEIRRKMVNSADASEALASTADAAQTLARHNAPRSDDGDAAPAAQEAPPSSAKKSPQLPFRRPDAYLSCPCCFELVCMDCAVVGTMRSNVWRALSLPEECAIDYEGAPASLPKRVQQILPHFASQHPSRPGKRRKHQKAPAPPEPAPLTGGGAPSPACHPLLCGTCSVRVGWFALHDGECYFDCAIPSEA